MIKPKAFWPATIVTGLNSALDVERASDGADFPSNIPAGTYYSAAELAAALDTGLTASALGASWTVGVSDSGRITITSSIGFRILWASGPGAAANPGALLGFAGDTVGGTTATAPNQHQSGWYPELPPEFDSHAMFEKLAAVTVAMSGRTKILEFAEHELREVRFLLRGYKMLVGLEGASHVNEALERLYRDGAHRFRWWPDGAVEGTYVDYSLDRDSVTSFRPARPFVQTTLKRHRLQMRRYVA